MSKGSKEKAMRQQPERPVADETSSGRFGLLAILVILTIVGIAVWLVVNQEETG